MRRLRDNLGHAWGQVQAGWNNLVSKASDALTRFTGTDKEADDEDGRTLMSLSPDWGVLAAEVRESDGEIRVRLEVPGMQPEDLEVEVLGRNLRISGEKRQQREADEGRYHVTECAYGRFERHIPLPVEVDASGTRADYKKGVLTLRLRKASQAKVRRIKIARN
jgi:HSP20 family protein